MRPSRVRTWGDLFWEMFMRGGLFSLQRLPQTAAERELDADRAEPPRDLTRLKLNDDGSAPETRRTP